MLQSITIIAFDQHAATTVAAVLLAGQRTSALHSLTSDSATILRFVERLRRQGPVQCCYEAGPCGFELQRALTGHEIPCDVIAPALIPRRPGDRIKTDRRDAGQLAMLYRAGALTAIHIPDRKSRARFASLSRGHPRRSAARPPSPLEVSAASWPPLHRHQVRGPNATPPGSGARRGHWRRWTRRTRPICGPSRKRCAPAAPLEQDLRGLLDLEPLRSRVHRLRCFRGIDNLTALTIAAELGDPRRFPSAAPPMAFVGLVPSEHLRVGPTRGGGGITKRGTPTCGASWSKRPGTIATSRLSAPPCSGGSAARRSRPLRRRGAPSNGLYRRYIDWPSAASRASRSIPPWPAS